MISERLLSKLEKGKKYLVTDGIRFYIFKPLDNYIYCVEMGWNTGVVSLHQKTWDEILEELEYYSDEYNSIYYDYNKDNPTYRYYAHVSSLFVRGCIDFSLYSLYFLGEYKKDTDITEVKRYCNLHGITYSWCKRKERLKEIYK